MNKNKQDLVKSLRIINRLIMAVYVLVIFFTPLIFAILIKNNNVFELNKTIFIRWAVIVLGLLTVTKILISPRRAIVLSWEFFRKYLLAPVLLFLFLGLSVLWSSDPWLSFYGLNDRQQGFRSLLFYGLFFVLVFYDLVSNSIDRAAFLRKVKIIALAVTASAFVVGVYALIQLLGLDFISWMEPAYLTHRTTSTLGQPNFLASFLLLSMPWVLYLLNGAKKFWFKIAYSGIFILEFLALLSTASRSAIAGLVLSGGLVLTVWFFLSRAYRNRKNLIIVAGSILASIIFAFSLWAASDFVRQRVAETISNSGGWSMSVRRFFWEASVKEIKNRPLIGYGLETQEIYIGRYYDTDWARFGEVNALTNRAHNWFLDNLLTGGIIGLLLWLWLWWKLFYFLKSSFNKDWNYFGLWLSAGVGAHFIALQAGFDVTVTSLYWWLILAVAMAIEFFNRATNMASGTPEKILENNSSKKIIRPGLGMVVILVLFMASLITIIKDVRFMCADYSFRKMKEALVDKDYVKVFIEYSKILPAKERSGAVEYYLTDALPWDLLDSLPKEVRPSIVSMLERAFESRGIDNPSSFFIKAKISAILKDYDGARYYFDRLVDWQTNWPKAYFNRGKLRLLAGDRAGAIADWNKVFLYLPEDSATIPDPKHYRSIRYYGSLVYQSLADLAFEQKEYESAEKYYRQAYSGNLNNLGLLKKIADTYYQRRDLDKAIYYNELGLKRGPDDYHWPLAIALLYQEKGAGEKVKEYAKLTLEIDPENAIAKSLLGVE